MNWENLTPFPLASSYLTAYVILFSYHICVSPSHQPSLVSQRQTSRRLGAFLPVNLDRDAVLHQTAPHYGTGVEQECEYNIHTRYYLFIYIFYILSAQFHIFDLLLLLSSLTTIHLP